MEDYFDKIISSYERKKDSYIFANIMDKIDFHFEIPLVTHCNLNCQMCTTFSPIATKEYIELDSFYADILRIQHLFMGKKIWLRLIGGEPLLHHKFNEIVLLSRKTFPNALITITTNGIKLLDKNNDFFSMLKRLRIILIISPYPLHISTKILSLLNYYNVRYFKTIESFSSIKFCLDIKGNQNAHDAFNRCVFQCNFLYNGNISKCFYPSVIRHFNKYFSQNVTTNENDTINIHHHNVFEILNFLKKPIPFCRYCNNQKLSAHKWAISKKIISEWV